MIRLDYQPLERSGVTRLDSGGLRIPATLTRTGIFRYTNPDGSERLEFRPPEEVLSMRVMDQARGVPLTLDHPVERRVDPETFTKLAIGHVGDDVRPHEDGARMAATVYVTRADAVDAVTRGTIGELSLGYRVDFDPTPGEHEGQAYHGVQRNLQINHVALVRRGRAGRDVGLRLDSEGDQIPERLEPVTKIRIGGKEYEAGSPEAQAAIDALALRADSAETEARKVRVGALRARLDSLDVEIRADAEATEGSVMAEAVKKICPDVAVDGMSPDYVAGAFAVALSILMRDAAAAKGQAPALETEDGEAEGEEPEPAPAGGTAQADAVRRDRQDSHTDTVREDRAQGGISISEKSRLDMIKRGESRRKAL